MDFLILYQADISSAQILAQKSPLCSDINRITVTSGTLETSDKILNKQRNSYDLMELRHLMQ